MFGFIGNIGPWELIFILLIALVVVGPGKLPEVAKSMGKAAREFKKATTGVQKEFKDAINFDDDSRNRDNKKDMPEQKVTEQDTDIIKDSNIENK